MSHFPRTRICRTCPNELYQTAARYDQCLPCRQGGQRHCRIEGCERRVSKEVKHDLCAKHAMQSNNAWGRNGLVPRKPQSEPVTARRFGAD